MAITGAIIAVAATAATTGYQASAAHDQKVEATHAKNDQIQAQGALQADAAAKNKTNLDMQGQMAARQRQRALAASYGTPTPGGLGNTGEAVGGGQKSTLLGF